MFGVGESSCLILDLEIFRDFPSAILNCKDIHYSMIHCLDGRGRGGQTHSYGGQFSKRFCLIFHFFSLKPFRDQDEDNDICYSPISSAVFELLSYKQTDIQTE